MEDEIKPVVNDLINSVVSDFLHKDLSPDYKQKITTLEKQVDDLQKELKKQKDMEKEEEKVRAEFRTLQEKLIKEENEKNEREVKNMGFEVIDIEPSKDIVPNIVIIVPYRDRQPQRSAFMKIMPHILEGKNCKVLIVHQRDNRPFNRGAMKNIGFLFVKSMYPKRYKDITLVFHDIDSMPWHKDQFSYETKRGYVNHFYGFNGALGGIFAIKAWDFEHINGFPNIWTWGLEDNIIKKRCVKLGKRVVLGSQFVNVEKDNKNIIGLWHGWERLISPNIQNKMTYDNGVDGIRSLFKLRLAASKMTDLFTEVNVVSFETGEKLSSPFVRNARMRNARENAHQNKPFYIRGPKRGAAGTFGKKRGFGGMAI